MCPVYDEIKTLIGVNINNKCIAPDRCGRKRKRNRQKCNAPGNSRGVAVTGWVERLLGEIHRIGPDAWCVGGYPF